VPDTHIAAFSDGVIERGPRGTMQARSVLRVLFQALDERRYCSVIVGFPIL
jgi:hypothetical protein